MVVVEIVKTSHRKDFLDRYLGSTSRSLWYNKLWLK